MQVRYQAAPLPEKRTVLATSNEETTTGDPPTALYIAAAAAARNEWSQGSSKAISRSRSEVS